MNRKSWILLLGFLFVYYLAAAQSSNDEKVPVFAATETMHDFGTIGESDGYVSHPFKFTNTGSAPLVITNVSVTCGCTQPDWTQTPVEPGQEGVINITYNPKGHNGPFTKPVIINTNENDGYKSYRLDISGVVVDKPSDPKVDFQDQFGGMGIETRNLVFQTFTPAKMNRLTSYIKNFNDEAVYFALENVPDYMTVQTPDSLKADWPSEIALTIDGVKTAKKRGRITDRFTLNVKNKDGEVLGSEEISVTVNYVDDFSRLSPIQSVSAPALDIKSTLLDFGQVKKGALGLGGTTNKPIILTNTGKSDLIIHSITGEDERVHLPDLNGKTIKAGESLTVNATIKSKEFISENLDTEIYVVCNDPKGPVRRIKVTAEKIN